MAEMTHVVQETGLDGLQLVELEGEVLVLVAQPTKREGETPAEVFPLHTLRVPLDGTASASEIKIKHRRHTCFFASTCTCTGTCICTYTSTDVASREIEIVRREGDPEALVAVLLRDLEFDSHVLHILLDLLVLVHLLGLLLDLLGVQ